MTKRELEAELKRLQDRVAALEARPMYVPYPQYVPYIPQPTYGGWGWGVCGGQAQTTGYIATTYGPDH